MRPTRHVPVVAEAKRDGRWRAMLEEHSAAVDSYAALAAAIPSSDWSRRPSPDAWSPAEITMHLLLSSEAALRELEGGPPMAPRLAWWMRPLVRWTVLPGILRGRGFPTGVKAPRETRPQAAATDAGETITLFRSRAAELERALDGARASGRRRVLTHPHFGGLGVIQSIGLLTRHVRHHHAQLDRVRAVLASRDGAAG